MPTACAAIPMRPPSSVAIATVKPRFSSWSRRSRADERPSKRMSAVEDELRPSFSSSRVTSTSLPSTRNALTPRVPAVDASVRAKTRNVPAWLPFVIHCFEPLSLQPSPSGTAAERSAPASDPESGSVSANAPMTRPAARSGTNRSPLLVGAEREDRERGGARVHGDGDADAGVGARELLEHEDVGEEVRAGASELLGHAHAHQPELAELREYLPREGVVAVPRRPREARSRRRRTRGREPGSRAARE